jgi:hypothetical protein
MPGLSQLNQTNHVARRIKLKAAKDNFLQNGSGGLAAASMGLR